MGAWIEILTTAQKDNMVLVAPLVGAWIEIRMLFRWFYCIWSLPSWERGLKLSCNPLSDAKIASLPSWERGLKYICGFLFQFLCRVAPLVGAWIEIYLVQVIQLRGRGRSPRGSVD